MPIRPNRLRLDEAQRGVGHAFADVALLDEALTHSSAAGLTRAGRLRRSNERLEFLGDRVLGLVVADLVLRAFPESDEGGLSQRYTALVRRETLTEVAAEIGLAAWLVLDPGEEGGGGRRNKGILADACEAMIGALYLDGGLDAAAAFVHHHWQARVQALTAPPRDAKTALQMWALARGFERPLYRVVGTTGSAHRPLFEIAVAIARRGEASGTGSNKRTAEQAAATALLQRLEAEDPS